MPTVDRKNKNFAALLEENRLLLIVSLPENNFEFAWAAFENGADAVKLHLNVTHKATGKRFSSWIEARKDFEKICEKLDLCVGVVPGNGQNFASEQDLLEMEQIGISFIDFFIDDAPTYVLNSHFKKMVALRDHSQMAFIHELYTFGIQAIELSTIPKEQYGERLTLLDLIRYSNAVKNSPLPCFVPTEKRIEPSEVEQFVNCGIKGLIIGPIVTGMSLIEFSKTVRSFRRYISDFNL